MLPTWAAEGPSIAVIDNGEGFKVSPEFAMAPFESTKPGGMGIGLSFSRMAMEANGGDLLIPESVDELDINTNLRGAAVVMRFRRAS
jgi:phosphoglycerate-specific signal transduction histidine kinase